MPLTKKMKNVDFCVFFFQLAIGNNLIKTRRSGRRIRIRNRRSEFYLRQGVNFIGENIAMLLCLCND
jgi:hypothetical protein